MIYAVITKLRNNFYHIRCGYYMEYTINADILDVLQRVHDHISGIK